MVVVVVVVIIFIFIVGFLTHRCRSVIWRPEQGIVGGCSRTIYCLAGSLTS